MGGILMNKHTVFVAGKHFVLLSEDKEKYVQNLATEVNDAINRIMLENPTLDRTGALTLCALDYADDMHKEVLRNKRLNEKAQPLIAQTDKQAKQLKELKAAVSEKDSEIERLRKELSELRDAFEKSTRILDGSGMVKTLPDIDRQPQKNNNQKKQPNKGYKPMRQYSLFDNETQT